MRWTILSTVACFLAVSLAAAAWAGPGAAKRLPPHRALSCTACHSRGGSFSDPASKANGAAGCVGCHQGYQAIFASAMGRRDGERRFVERSWGKMDRRFWEKNCTSCHLTGCLDCHGAPHAISLPKSSDCQLCHKGYYTGWDYSGRAPREDNMRYQRGIAVNGETFVKMIPDVHYRAGMTCGACHGMRSLLPGGAPRGCRDCHRPSPKVLEHRIAAHMERLECYACHSAWGAQEYGTFMLRFRDPALKEGFDLKPGPNAEYLRSSYLKKQDAPPLGINSRGRISPIRPEFIAYYTDVAIARQGGGENLLLAAEWRAFFPHTVQRGTAGCEACHDNPRRFLLEPPEDRIYSLTRDGMGLASFWSQDGQRMVNGSFLPAARYGRMNAKGPDYKRMYVEKWKKFLGNAGGSSPR
ncbi:cytochrome c [Geomonas sp. Red276]